MDEHDFDAWIEGRTPLIDCVRGTTEIMRDQIAAAPNMPKIERAMMTIGCLLATIPDEAKQELLDLIRTAER